MGVPSCIQLPGSRLPAGASPEALKVYVSAITGTIKDSRQERDSVRVGHEDVAQGFDGA
jgi:hypothetical protein